ncbi:serine/threonine-protein kinase nemo isoform X2 [Megachile rotundata]|uniref:serine/threonine-protein kinase nemo isoform X2 n=1 Tax=Megachile rotundata TaxID=143995 RepID=UPI003FD126F1
MAVVGPSRHSRVSMSVSMSLLQGGGAGATGGSGTTGTHPGQAVLAAAAAAAAAAQPPPTYYHPAAPAPPPPPPAQDPVQPDRPIGYGAFGVVWAVTDPRDGRRVALKKLPNVFQSLVSSKRVFRELKMLCFFKHENVLSALDILQPPHLDFFQEIYVITELLQSDLHKIIVSPQHLSPDHIKVFLYQILRGLKYLHSARILHRDIKPGNLLVNSNCVLKICDFGLARVEEPDQNKHMTQEVVTQYYRAPEILMGARHYTAAVDVWSVGCIFGELLRRRILFQAQSPVQQLELITELLGTPTLEDMRYACEGARSHMLRRAPKPPSLTALYTLSSQATHEAVHLLCQMLVFDPDKRITVVDALAHPYLDEGRLRYHSCMCTCCYTTSGGMRQYTGDFEPATSHPFDDLWERKLTTVQQVKVRASRSPTQRPTPRIRTRYYYHYQYYRISYLPLSATIDYYRYRLPLLLLPLLLPLLLLLLLPPIVLRLLLNEPNEQRVSSSRRDLACREMLPSPRSGVRTEHGTPEI